MAKKRTRKHKKTQPATRADFQVFVSHATADKWLATVFCEKIEAVGATTFRDDRDIDGGDDIPEEIRSQIQQSRELVVLLTPESADRPWVLLEVGAAWGWRKGYRVVPVLCHVSVDAIEAGFDRFTDDECCAIVDLYEEQGVSADRLSLNLGALRQLAIAFRQRTEKQVSAERLLSEIYRLRKNGRLPRIRERNATSG